MDLSVYSTGTQKIIEELQQVMQAPGNRVFTLLAQLKKAPETGSDGVLTGFLNYCYAIAYNVRDKQSESMKYLKRAVSCLLRTEERELLARAFNLFAIRAQYNGCFDVAYNYFSVAASFVEDLPGSLISAIVKANLGDLLAEMGEFRKAAGYIRKSIPVIERHTEDVLRRQYHAFGLINLGMYEYLAGDVAAAERELRKLKRIVGEDGRGAGERAEFLTLVFRAVLASARGDREEAAELARDVTAKIRKAPMFCEYMKEIRELCRVLIGSGEKALAEKLIAEIGRNRSSAANPYSAIAFVQLEIDYHNANGARGKALASYAERHDLSRRAIRMEKQIYREAIELMLLIEELRDDQERAERENRILQQRAETDALTGLPNRYAFNRVLEESFVRALQRGERIAVGIADIDNFKYFNDIHGHAEGDRCLVAVGRELEAIAQERELFVARYGGDEFVLIYENREDRMIREIEAEIRDRLHVKITHGFYGLVPDENTRLWDCLAEADRRLYQKKRKWSS